MFCNIYRGKGKSSDKLYDFKESYDGRSIHPHLCNNRKYFISLLGKELQYRDYFTQEDMDKLREAYNKAHDIRKFEIDLYWKRATYFWTLTAALITIFGLFLSNYLKPAPPPPTNENLLVSLSIVSSIGFLLSIFSLMTITSGKYWQKNWEFHITKLQFLFSGDLYQNNIPREKYIYSISNINEKIHGVFIISWTIAILISAGSIKEIDYFFITVFVTIFLILGGFIYSQKKKPNH